MSSILSRLVAASTFIALSPVILIIGAAIKLEDGGPAFFKQERVGKHGNMFTCYKFRTMRQDAEGLLEKWQAENHPIWQRYVESNFKLKEDPRVTKVGQLLRKTSFDELAQLINVVLGEMNLVGPRPLLSREVAEYGESRFKVYCQMVPGITGLWQVSGRSNTTFDERAELDVAYFKKRSWSFDARIILKTFLVLMKRDGAY